MRKFSFNSKNVLITCASGDLGSAMVKLPADWKVRLVVTSRSENNIRQPGRLLFCMAIRLKPADFDW